jgi:hypothetical protein
MSKDLDPTGGMFSGEFIEKYNMIIYFFKTGPKDTMVGKVKGPDKPPAQT